MATQKEVRTRIASVKNIEKITRAMEMVAAARLRRAEQRIEQLRPYAEAIRRMTRRAVEAAESIPSLPLLEEHDAIDKVGLLLVTGDRGLAGAFNSQIIRAGNARNRELQQDTKDVRWYASGRRGVSSIQFRGLELGSGRRRSRRKSWKSSRAPRGSAKQRPRHPGGETRGTGHHRQAGAAGRGVG